MRRSLNAIVCALGRLYPLASDAVSGRGGAWDM